MATNGDVNTPKDSTPVGTTDASLSLTNPTGTAASDDGAGGTGETQIGENPKDILIDVLMDMQKHKIDFEEHWDEYVDFKEYKASL